MTQLTIDLPDDLRAKVEARAAAAGHATVAQYVQALLREDAAEVDDLGGPDSISYSDVKALEDMLARRLTEGGPSVEATPDLWRELQERARRGGGAGGPGE